MTTLPATLIEAEATEFARAEIAWFHNNPVSLFGIDVRMLDEGDNRAFARHTMKGHALAHPLNMMKIVDYAWAGWDLADEALRELIIEFEYRSETKPPPLANYAMEIARGSLRRPPGPKKSDHFLRDIALMMVVESVGQKFRLKPTRSRTSKRPSACSIVAKTFGLSEAAIVALWQRFGRYL